jgi:hypothetical protein
MSTLPFLMSHKGHSRPSHFVPVLNNVRYASDSDHSRYESELTLWAKSRHLDRCWTDARYLAVYKVFRNATRSLFC